MTVRVSGTRDARLIADVRRIVRRLSRDFKPDDAAVDVIFTSNVHIHDLNLRFRHRDRPTDVLSFNLDTPRLPGEKPLLGEVYVSRDQARIQAREYGVPYAEELRRLVIHGLLHLLGLTHAQMDPWQRTYLSTP